MKSPHGPETEVGVAFEGVDEPRVFLRILGESDGCFHIL